MSENLKTFFDQFSDDDFDLREYFRKFIINWYWFLISLLLFFLASFFYLRYTQVKYRSSAKIEIIDKSQYTDMALPTSMTIFNRSTINLDNEIGRLTSYDLHSKVVKNLGSNIDYFSVGLIKDSKNHQSQWFDNYDLVFNQQIHTIEEFSRFEIELNENFLVISHFDRFDNLLNSYNFKSYSTEQSNHKLPFNLKINDPFTEKKYKRLIINPFSETVEKYKNITEVESSSMNGDQLTISLNYSNSMIARQYIDELHNQFNLDGIKDRQLEYKRTIEFVENRSSILLLELNEIENEKLLFKSDNNITDLKYDASVYVQQQFEYQGELFDARSQQDLIELLEEVVIESLTEFKLLPVNIGIENSSINSEISKYNELVSQRNSYLIPAGRNNSVIKNVENLISKHLENILISIENYKEYLEMNIIKLETKESEFNEIYNNLPRSEKILRSIERKLNVKESLYLLLLTKKEEASINFAVVKPSIKVVDFSRTNKIPVSPNRNFVILSAVFFGLFLPFIVIVIIHAFDDKIHDKSQLNKLLNQSVPIIGEIPDFKNKSPKTLADISSRSVLAESIRILIANFNFNMNMASNKSKCSVVLVTSSIKGEGKTIISSNIANQLSSNNNKVLLIGSDLRNPQIHKIISTERTTKGLSDLIYKNDVKSYKKYITTYKDLDIILSGTIPPNPSELLSSKIFKDFIKLMKSKYDYIIIDSAPCILVSDTFEISKLVDMTIYVVRANYSSKNLTHFIRESISQKKLKNVNLVLNDVGSGKGYGYQYGYKYGYNYGYGYGYSSKD